MTRTTTEASIHYFCIYYCVVWLSPTVIHQKSQRAKTGAGLIVPIKFRYQNHLTESAHVFAQTLCKK